MESIVNIIIALIPVIGIIAGSIVIGNFVKSYFDYKKYLIENGWYKPADLNLLRQLLLLLGFVSMFTGIPLTLVFYLVNGISYSILGGLIPLFSGVGIIFFYIYSSR